MVPAAAAMEAAPICTVAVVPHHFQPGMDPLVHTKVMAIIPRSVPRQRTSLIITSRITTHTSIIIRTHTSIPRRRLRPPHPPRIPVLPLRQQQQRRPQRTTATILRVPPRTTTAHPRRPPPPMPCQVRTRQVLRSRWFLS